MASWRGERTLTSMKDHTLCALHLATGTRDECPAEACAFWEDGGAVVESGCIFERVRLELEEVDRVATPAGLEVHACLYSAQGQRGFDVVDVDAAEDFAGLGGRRPHPSETCRDQR